jgi:hypothetical protein
MAIRLDSIPETDVSRETDITAVDMVAPARGVRLSDVSGDPHDPGEIKKESMKIFGRATEKKIPLTLAQYQLQQEVMDENNRRNLFELKKAGFEVGEIHGSPDTFGVITAAPDLTVFEVAEEAKKAQRRGVLGALKSPGVLMQMYAEQAPTREERRAYAGGKLGKLDKAALAITESAKKAGNNIVNYYNGLSEKEPISDEMRLAMQQPFMKHPFSRTTVNVSESTPTYAMAVASTLLTRNPSTGLALLGTTTATQTYEELRDEGLNPDLALFGSAVVGSIEIATEKVPMDVLLKGGGKSFLARAIRSGTAESFQELFAQMGQNYVTAVVKDVEDEGLVRAAQQEWSVITQGWQDSIASGGVMGIGASIFSGGSGPPETRVTELQKQVDFLTNLKNVRESVKKIETEQGLEAAVYMKGFKARLTTIHNQASMIVEGTKRFNQAMANVTPEELEKNKVIFKKDVGTLVEGIKSDLSQVMAHYQGIAKTLSENKEALPELVEIEMLLPAFEAAVGSFIASPSEKTFTELKTVGDQVAKLSKSYGERITTERAKTIIGVTSGVSEPGGPPGEAQGVEGAVKKTPYKLAKSVERRAIEAGVIESFGELPTGETMNLQVQAEKSLDFINAEPDRAFRVAQGLEDAPAGLYPENVFKAYETMLKAEGDAVKLKELAFSPEALRVSRILGQRIVSLRDDSKTSVVNDMRDISEARQEAVKRKKTNIPDDTELAAIKERLRRAEERLAEYVAKKDIKPLRKNSKQYGANNKVVSRQEYLDIINRRKAMPGLPGAGKRKGAAYVPTPQDFADLTKIGMYHLEAIGRNFTTWSRNVIADLGDWVKPYLDVEYDNAIQAAKAQGIRFPQDKQLDIYKKRLQTMTAKKEALFAEGEFGKPVRGKVTLDAEGRKLKRAYEAARDKLKVAQDVAGIITDEEAVQLTELARVTEQKKEIMLNGPRRTSAGKPTQVEMEYGIAQVLYSKYVAELKKMAEKKTFSEFMSRYLKNPLQSIVDLGGVARSLCASLDNSFIGRQGLKVFYNGVFSPKSAKIWGGTFINSFNVIWKTFRGKGADVMMSLKAMQISDPEYDLILKTKTDIATVEEEIPSELPAKLPVVGIAFKAGENAFNYSAHYMRYRLAKMYLNVWRNAGRDMDSKQELEDIGRLVNSLTGRGDVGMKGKGPGIINNLFWSPRNIKADIDFLTFHAFDANMSFFAKRQAVVNLLRFAAGAAAILLIADFFDDDSVAWDSNSSNFGKIKVGNSRFSVGAGIPIMIVLASRIASGSTTSSITGEKKNLNTGEYGKKTKVDLVFSFLENKAAPATSVAIDLLKGQTRDREKPTVKGEVSRLLTPLTIQNYYDTKSVEDSANVLTVIMAETLGINTQTYGPYDFEKKKPAGPKKGSRL